MIAELPTAVRALLADVGVRGRVVFLTGAGISAESGIPTFRGPEGYWRIGSTNYQPEELATHAAFTRLPEEIWAWYLYRRGVCLRAEPNAAHRAVVELDRALGERFVLITQNVDGLHVRAGSPPSRTFQIHGHIDSMRCVRGCGSSPDPIPAAIDLDWPKDRGLADTERALLRCSRCQGRTRPHVLWFDESYDEAHFRFESSIRAARAADLLVVVGTSGQTNLPLQVGAIAAQRGVPIIAINPEPSPFTSWAEGVPGGAFLAGSASQFVPLVAGALIGSPGE